MVCWPSPRSCGCHHEATSILGFVKSRVCNNDPKYTFANVFPPNPSQYVDYIAYHWTAVKKKEGPSMNLSDVDYELWILVVCFSHKNERSGCHSQPEHVYDRWQLFVVVLRPSSHLTRTLWAYFFCYKICGSFWIVNIKWNKVLVVTRRLPNEQYILWVAVDDSRLWWLLNSLHETSLPCSNTGGGCD